MQIGTSLTQRYAFALLMTLAVACSDDSSGDPSTTPDSGGNGDDVRFVETGTDDPVEEDADAEEEDVDEADGEEQDGDEADTTDTTDAADDEPDGPHVPDGPTIADISVADVVDPGCGFEPGYIDDEVCGDGLDNDANGFADEGCPCTLGSTQSCFIGPPNARGVGACLDGIQLCAGGTWGICEGGIAPSDELCDTKDNDCNGCVDDDILACEPTLNCPEEDFSAPLRNYTLDALSILEIDDVDASTFLWSVTPPRNSASPGPLDPSAAVTQFFMDVSGDYLVTLNAVDDKGTTHGCSWIVHAQGDGLRVELVWDTFGSTDLDLHVHRSRTETNWCTGDDCYYANCQSGTDLGWGYPISTPDVCPDSTCPNPRLDIDNISGFDPENINIDNPNDGDTFRVMVHVFSNFSGRISHPRLSIYCGGALQGVFGDAPDLVELQTGGSGCMGETWRVADVKTEVDDETGATRCRINVLTDTDGDWDIRLNDPTFYP